MTNQSPSTPTDVLSPVSREGQGTARWKRPLLIALGLVLLPLLAALWMEWQIRRLEKEMREQGLPVTRSELERFQTRPDQSEESANRWKELDGQWKAALSALHPEDARRLQTPDSIPASGKPWRDIGKYDELLQRLRPTLSIIQEQLQQPGQGWDRHSGQPRRELFRVLMCELRVSIHQGDSERAFQAMRAMAGLVDIERGQADFLSMLSWLAYVGIIEGDIENALPHVSWTDSQLRDIQQRLCGINYHDELRFALAAEVVEYSEAIKDQSPTCFIRTNYLQALRSVRAAQPGLQLPWPQMRLAMAAVDQIYEKPKNNIPWYNWPQKTFLQIYTPQRLYAFAMAQQVLATILIDNGLAVQRYQLRHKTLPKSFQDIDSDLLENLPDGTSLLHDPRDGLPLKFIVESDHIKIMAGVKPEYNVHPEFRVYRAGAKPVVPPVP